jgi:hypothetical protein
MLQQAIQQRYTLAGNDNEDIAASLPDRIRVYVCPYCGEIHVRKWDVVPELLRQHQRTKKSEGGGIKISTFN